jgi:hypothetical protein
MSDAEIAAVAPSVFATEAHQSRSERFAYISTADVLKAMRSEGFEVVAAIQGRSRVEGKADFTKHMLRFRHPDYMAAGVAAPEAVLMNAHDGTSSWRALAGAFRSICTNSLICMEDGASDIRVPHKGDVVGKVIEGTFEILGESQKTLAKVEAWQGVALAEPEQAVFAKAAHLLRFGKVEGDKLVADDSAFEPGQLLRIRRKEDADNNLWAVFNRVQENAVRGGLRAWQLDKNGNRRRVTSREVTGIDGNVKLNTALWLLAEEMAVLKQAA